jgi:Domain of unknown function (DUF4440)
VRLRLRLLLLLLLVSVEPMFASSCKAYPAGSWSKDRASALQFEQAWLDVLKQKNPVALDCMLANEFKDTSMKGVLRSKAQVLHELPLRKDQYQQTLVDLEADLFGDTAVVHGINIISDQQGHEVLRIRFTDVLCFNHGRWLPVSAQETVEAQH